MAVLSNMRTRRKIGIVLAVLAPVAFVLLALADVRLVTMSSRHLDATGVTTSSMHLHWPLLIPAGMFITGVALALVPRHEDAA
jgi:hypothetical protein